MTRATPTGQPAGHEPSPASGLGPTGDHQAQGELKSWQRDHQREALRANRAEDRFLRAEERVAELEALLAPLGRLPILLQRYRAFLAKRGQA
jgi:hypothetical protein